MFQAIVIGTILTGLIGGAVENSASNELLTSDAPAPVVLMAAPLAATLDIATGAVIGTGAVIAGAGVAVGATAAVTAAAVALPVATVVGGAAKAVEVTADVVSDGAEYVADKSLSLVK